MTETAAKNPMSISHDDVVRYLKNNTDFLKDSPEICDLLLPPSVKSKTGVADFQGYMIERLKADKEEVIESTRELVENARSNMNNQQRIQKTILRMLEASSFEDFVHSITMDLSSILDIDIAAIVVESEGDKIPDVGVPGIRMIPQGTVTSWMGDKTVMMQDNISGLEPIYGGGATLVQSQILLRVDISMNTPPAILAFGSRDPNMFAEGQATDQVLFLARVIERCFRFWLDVPKG